MIVNYLKLNESNYVTEFHYIMQKKTTQKNSYYECIVFMISYYDLPKIHVGVLFYYIVYFFIFFVYDEIYTLLFTNGKIRDP